MVPFAIRFSYLPCGIAKQIWYEYTKFLAKLCQTVEWNRQYDDDERWWIWKRTNSFGLGCVYSQLNFLLFFFLNSSWRPHKVYPTNALVCTIKFINRWMSNTIIKLFAKYQILLIPHIVSFIWSESWGEGRRWSSCLWRNFWTKSSTIQATGGNERYDERGCGKTRSMGKCKWNETKTDRSFLRRRHAREIVRGANTSLVVHPPGASRVLIR